jgi:DnaJ-class molecular chaperone
MSKIIICNACNGTGKTEFRVGWEDYELKECWTCKGSGRLLETTTVKYEPYKPTT